MKSSSTRLVYGTEDSTTINPHLFISTDNGQTTATGFNPVGRTDIYRVYGIGVDPTNENLWAANIINLTVNANERPIYSTDGGVTWNSVAPTAASQGGSNSSIPYYGTTSKFISSMNRAGTPRLVQSTDGGQTYSTLQNLGASANIYHISEENNAGVGFVSLYSDSPYKTTDGGATWAVIGHPNPLFAQYACSPSTQPYNIPAIT